MNNEEIFQKNVLSDVMSGVKSKAEVARQFGVSPRTIGRWIEKHNSDLSGCKTDQCLKREAGSPAKLAAELLASHQTKKVVTYNVIVSDNIVCMQRRDGDVVKVESAIAGDPRFDKAKQILEETGDEVKAWECLSADARLQSFSNGKVRYDERTGSITVDIGSGVSLPSKLADRIIRDFKKGNDDFEKYCRFSEKLARNPDRSVIDQLYMFLEAYDIDIDSDGDVIAYKRVRDDYTDCYTGKFDNTPGKEVYEPRSVCNPDPNQTCSKGLHVCSIAYLRHYSGARVVQVKINPEDFVAVPMEYFSRIPVEDSDEQEILADVAAKARVCRYFVMLDVTEALRYAM